MAVLIVGVGQTYTTIQAAVSAAQDGDEIQVRAGTYREQIVIDKAITLVGASRDSVIIEAPDTPVASGTSSINDKTRTVIVDVLVGNVSKSDVFIKDLTIDGRGKGTADSYGLVGLGSQNSNTSVDNVHIKAIREPLDKDGNYQGNSNSFGVLAEGTDLSNGARYKFTIKNSLIDEFQKTGIIAWGKSLNAIIQDNQIIGAAELGRPVQNGMQIGSAGDPREGVIATITGNTLTNLGYVLDPYLASGILLSNTGVAEVASNIITAAAGDLDDTGKGSLVAINLLHVPGNVNVHDNKIMDAYDAIVTEKPLQNATYTLSNNDVSGSHIAFRDGPDPLGTNATTINVNSTVQSTNKSGLYLYQLFGGDDVFTDTGVGNTRVEGGDGNDTITTGRGNDVLIGGAGSDTLKGGAGNDVFQGTVEELNGDTIQDFSVDDRLVVTDADLTSLNGKTATGTLTLASGKAITLNNLPAGATWNVTCNAATTTSTVKLSLPSTDSGGGGGGGPAPQPLVDGVAVTSTSTMNSDGSLSQIMTVPVVTTGRVESVGNASVADIPLFKTAGGVSVVNAEVPVGFGLSVTGSGQAKSPSASLTDLIREIKAHTPSGSSDQTTLVGGGTKFLDGLVPSNSLIVQTIVPTLGGASTPPGSPLIINGTPAAEGIPKVALVIDGHDLPTGTVLQLHNVDFAVVVGNLTVTGGTGSQVVWGDSGNQTINLGADDDILFGGGGDDKISSKGGDDRLFGNSGRDELSGGEGKDFLHGGEGQDVALFERTSDRYVVTQNHAVVTVRSLDDPTDVDTLVNIETIRFKDKDVQLSYATKIEMIARLYKQLFDRQGDMDGVQFWAEKLSKGASAGDIVTDFFSSQESRNMKFQQYSKDGAITLELLYEVLFSRKSDDAGYAYWQTAQSKGMSLTEIANHFAYSPEMQAKYVPPTGWEFLV
ncbi:DUF4214 domain-containing protein [Rhizobium oryzicola]|uniref:DUF4214 domain-containing protein n=1 Tax=Rhizobium oryzicola TaxID=1232668 RepID=A0ABT8SV83_9HYPH|nr:DUF4214 domain-containing protein [Rhizobium oryzicola]MDO1582241.1 DUF4214 domain-containing protein [Rhizobium oryzicola]